MRRIYKVMKNYVHIRAGMGRELAGHGVDQVLRWFGHITSTDEDHMLNMAEASGRLVRGRQ